MISGKHIFFSFWLVFYVGFLCVFVFAFFLLWRYDLPTVKCPDLKSKVRLTNACICVAAAAKLLQSCPTLCDPIEGSPPGSPVPEILQARILEWVAISFSSAWKQKVKVKLLSCVWLLATPWTVAHQAPSMGFSRQEYWSGVPLPSPIHLCYHYANQDKDFHFTRKSIHAPYKPLPTKTMI